MNDEMPWVNLTQEEVDELRNKKHELTEYGKQKLREMMTHEEMLEEAARREAENKALAALDELYEKHGDAMLKLAEIEKEEWERKEHIENLQQIKSELSRLQRYDDELSSVMPKDYKDWWQNSKEEWPIVAKSSIESLREREEIAWEHLAIANKKLEDHQ